jgi:hypothetical protein
MGADIPKKMRRTSSFEEASVIHVPLHNREMSLEQVVVQDSTSDILYRGKRQRLLGKETPDSKYPGICDSGIQYMGCTHARKEYRTPTGRSFTIAPFFPYRRIILQLDANVPGRVMKLLRL